MKKILQVFWTFFKIGLFTFGGGYAMIAIIENECIERRGWITQEEFMDLTVLAESTPGPISINSATYIGYRRAGLIGAIAGSIGVVLPSFVIIYVISLFLNNLLDYPVIAHAFAGIKVCVGILILRTGVKMFRKLKKRPVTIAVFALSALATVLITIFSWNFTTIYLILISGGIGLLLYLVERLRERRKGAEK